jgi:Fe-S cluster assembly protein SufD
MSGVTAAESVLAEVRAHYADRSDGLASALPDAEAAWMGELRSVALERFRSLGFPTTRHEDWRYTNLAAIAKQPLELATHDQQQTSALRDCVAASRFADLDAEFYVFVNGRFDASLSDSPLSDRFASLATLRTAHDAELEALVGSCVDDKDALAALNTAFLDDGAVVRAAVGDQRRATVHLLFISSGPGISHPRVLVIAEPDSQLNLIQDHVSIGSAESVTNAVTEARVGANAAVSIVLLQREGDSGQLFTSTRAIQERSSRFAEHTLTLGGKLVRNHLATALQGEGAECSLRGLFIGKGKRHIDNHTLVDHAVPHCNSNELYKGILDDASRGVFRGRVLVQRDAQKTDAVQSNPNLLLADSAEIDTKPQLEIYADDVRCNHGSAIGRLDPEALFYLRARGIGERQAREFLTQGFAQEITAALPQPAIAEGVRALLFGDLEGMAEIES